MFSSPSLAYSPSRLSRSVTKTCSRPRLAQAHERLRQVGRLGGVPAGVGAVGLERGVGRVAVLGDPERPVEPARGEPRPELPVAAHDGVNRAAQVHVRDVELVDRVGSRRGEHALEPGGLVRAHQPAEQHPRPRGAGLDLVVGGAQHPRVLLGRAVEGPGSVRLVDDLPVPDRAGGVFRDLAREPPEVLLVRAGGRSEQDPQHGKPVLLRELDHLVEAAPVRLGVGGREDPVQLHVDPDVVRPEPLRLAEDALLHRRSAYSRSAPSRAPRPAPRAPGRP